MKDFFRISSNSITSRQQLIVFGLFTLILVIFYGNTLHNGYSLDDEYAYTSNPLATNGLSDVKSIFASQSFDYGSFKFGYRPISVLSFALENQFFGVDAKVSHSINLVLYLLITLLVFTVLIRLFPEEKAGLALFTSFLFLILPIHTEIVNNIKCRDELLMLFFGLVSVLLWIKGKEKKGYYLFSILALLLAVLSKKSALVFLGIIPVIEFFRSNGNWKRSFVTTSLMILPVLLFKLTARFVKTTKSSREYSFVENPLYGGDLEVNQPIMILESAWFYFKNLLFQTQFVSYYGYKTIEFQKFGYGSIMAIIVLISLLSVAIIALKKQRVFAFGAIVLLGCLLPYINWITPMVGIVAERFISTSSIGFVILVVYGINYLLETYGKPVYKKYAVVCLMLYAVAYYPVIQARNSEWKSQITVFEADVQKEPESVVLNTSLGNNYFYKFIAAKSNKERNEYGSKALKYSTASVLVYPTQAGYTDKGTAEYKVYGQVQKAEESFKMALELDSTYEGALNKLSMMCMELNRKEESVKYFRSLIQKYPNKYIYYEGYIRQLCQMNKFDEAFQAIDKALTEQQNAPLLVLLKANIYSEKKEYANALVWFKKADQLDPQNKAILGKINYLNNQIKKAE
tara:strand:- start:27916 stop:29802 length:1887 start_codon:yes stop_codon:yes gene_type:complete